MGITLILWPMAMPTIIRLTSAVSAYRAGVVLFLVINALLPEMRLAKQSGDSLLWPCLSTAVRSPPVTPDRCLSS